MSKKEKIRHFVRRKINVLQAEAKYSGGKAMLANLRRGIGHEPGEVPQLFGVFLQGMPEEFISKNGMVTGEEWVCYITLTLYALHQQGHDMEREPMHTEENVSVGAAMGRLLFMDEEDPNAEQRMLRRLQMLATAVDRKEVSHHLRGMIQLLKSKGIPLNYEKLAADLYGMQFPEEKKQVCLSWGQDLYRSKDQEKEDKTKENGED